MSTHHARCIVCDEDCYCTSEPFWFNCGFNGPFAKPRALCSRECADVLLGVLTAERVQWSSDLSIDQHRFTDS